MGEVQVEEAQVEELVGEAQAEELEEELEGEAQEVFLVPVTFSRAMLGGGQLGNSDIEVG